MQRPDSFAPSLFVSHGAPTVALIEDDYANALRNFGENLGRHWDAILVISAHWVSAGPVQIAANPSPPTLHDFRGFQKELYKLEYPAPGSLELALEIRDLLERHDINSKLNMDRGFDHGVWIPLLYLRPQADLPVVQISLPMLSSPRELLKIGKVLSPLRERSVLFLASGGAVHNLEKIQWSNRASADERAVAFDSWLKNKLCTANVEELLAFEESAPHKEFAHPTNEHLLPMFFTLGSSMAGDRLLMFHEGFQYGSLSMRSFALC